MLAPCMTVLSTSKNAAAVGSGGVGQRGLHLGGRGGRLAGERRALLRGAAGVAALLGTVTGRSHVGRLGRDRRAVGDPCRAC